MKTIAFAVAFFILFFFTFANAASVTLGWLSVPNADGYRIYYGDEIDDKIFSINTGNATTWKVERLDCGKDYFFEIRAYNANGASLPTQTVTAITANCPPALVLPQGWEINGVWIVPEP